MLTIGAWDAAVVAARAVTYGSTLAAAGGTFFLWYCDSLIASVCADRIRRLIRVLACIAAVAGALMIVVTSASMSGDAGGLADAGQLRMILLAGEGRASLARLIGLVLIFAGLAANRGSEGLAALRFEPARRAMGLVGSATAATSFAWLGHVHSLSALRNDWLPLLAIVVHLLCVAFWLGALMPLLMVAGDSEVTCVAAAARRFGVIALIVVSALLAAGMVLLGLLLGSFGQLWADDYGRLVLSKILLVCCLLGLAGWNHWRLTPKLMAREQGALRALKRSIKVELALAGCVLAVTAAMTTLTGPPALDI